MAAADDTVTAGAFRYILGWVVLYLLLSLINRSRLGHVVIYYALCLMILSLVLTQSPFIASALSGLRTKPG